MHARHCPSGGGEGISEGTHSMATAKWLDIQECKDTRTLKEFHARDLAWRCIRSAHVLRSRCFIYIFVCRWDEMATNAPLTILQKMQAALEAILDRDGCMYCVYLTWE